MTFAKIFFFKWVIFGLLILMSAYAAGYLIFHLAKLIGRLDESHKYDIFRVFIALIGVLAFISLFTYNPFDYLKDGSLNLRHILNKGGIAGALVSYWGFKIFGKPVFILPAILIAWAIVPRKYIQQLIYKTLFAIFSMITLEYLFGLIQNSVLQAGFVGEALANKLTKYLGIGGAWTIFGFAVIGLCMSIPSLWQKIKNIIKFKIKPKEQPKEKPKPVKETIPESKPIPKEPLVKTKPHIQQEEIIPKETTLYEPAMSPLTQIQKKYLEILEEPVDYTTIDNTELAERTRTLERRLEEFQVQGKVKRVSQGPVITLYEYEPAPGIKVHKIVSLADELGLAMKSGNVRIAPIEGTSCVGIEVPNQKRATVYLKKIIRSKEFSESKAKLTFVLGDDISGNPVVYDLASCPHLLIAGATGSGKSVCLNVIVASLLARNTHDDVRFIMIDPKRLELTIYNGIPHLLCPVISEPKSALNILKDMLILMEKRYKEFAKVGVRDIEGFNQKSEKKKPYIVIMIDELADLMLTTPREFEEALTRLAQMSRAVGMHIVIATQRPSVDIITGIIKANFPARIAFQVASRTDSRTILDMIGAEKLLGRGDMLFLPPGKGTPIRLHGAYISIDETKAIANLWTEWYLTSLLYERGIKHAKEIAHDLISYDAVDAIILKHELPGGIDRIKHVGRELMSKYNLSEEFIDMLMGLEYYPPIIEGEEAYTYTGAPQNKEDLEETDPLFEEAKRLVILHQTASVSMLQRHFKIGYARAGRIIDQLERAGIIGPYAGSKSREVLVPRDALKGENLG